MLPVSVFQAFVEGPLQMQALQARRQANVPGIAQRLRLIEQLIAAAPGWSIRTWASGAIRAQPCCTYQAASQADAASIRRSH
jgi:hypothetical protein